MKGAEAVLRKISVLGLAAVEKQRISKKYRQKPLDTMIRSGRTKREARLLCRAKLSKVLCPVVYQVNDFSIIMKYLPGKMLHKELEKRKIRAKEIAEAASILVKLHSQDIIHGDYTPANLMLTSQGMAVIDFGLGYVSFGFEDKATDLVTMKKALGAYGQRFINAYARKGGSKAIAKQAQSIEKRARYMERG